MQRSEFIFVLSTSLVLVTGCDNGTVATPMDGGSDARTDARSDARSDTGASDTGASDTGAGDTGTDARSDSGDAALPTAAPTQFAVVADGTDGIRSPTDAVASPDGQTFYFAAFNANDEPTIYSVLADGSAAPVVRFSGAPLAYPSGLALSCDGTTLYVVDPAADTGTGAIGQIFALASSGATAPTALAFTGIEEPNAIAVNATCDGLVISGRTPSGQPAIFRAGVAAGTATAVATGGALVAPTGLYDAADAIWFLDHLATGNSGQGALFKITATGPTAIVGGLRLGTPGGVSGTAGGGNIVIGARTATGAATLVVVNTTSNAVSETALPTGFVDPAGLRTARGAGVFAMVDSEGSAIYSGR